VGDDYQLPPCKFGAFEAVWKGYKKKESDVNPVQELHKARGQYLFREAGKNVMTLRSAKRVLPSQIKLTRILDAVRGESKAKLLDEDVAFLTDLHLENDQHTDTNKIFTDGEKQQIDKQALYLFANREPRDRMNVLKLRQCHSETNPVAKIKAHTTDGAGDIRCAKNQHYDKESQPVAINICREARVQLTGRNVCPEWGLFNGSLGTVKDIVFEVNQSPNQGDLPLYVMVEFDMYCGPVFCKDNPRLVPISAVETVCPLYGNPRCCKRRFIPLKLAFGKTVHTFQGANVGPVGEGQPPNAIQCIVCDPGTTDFEGHNIGLFYTILSRITSFGDESDKMTSSIYFTGTNMNASRVENLFTKTTGKPYIQIEKRKRWVDFLMSHNHDSGISDADKQDIFTWAQNTRYTDAQLETFLHNHHA
jgi:hypothetical protein